MKKMIFFLILATVAVCSVVIVSDTKTLQAYANKIGTWIGYGEGYTLKTANAVEDSVRSTASAVDDLRDGKAHEIIVEQRKKIEEMRKELESAMNNSAAETSEKDKSEDK